MNRVLSSWSAASLAGFCVFSLGAGSAQAQERWRKEKPLPPTSHIVVFVEKAFDNKPIENAAVIFHATHDGHDDGNLEVKTDPQGRATIDLIEVGSQVTVQVIANGLATAAREIDNVGPTEQMLIKMQSPRAQVSQFEDNQGKPSQLQPGIQQHVVPPAASAPSSSSIGPQ